MIPESSWPQRASLHRLADRRNSKSRSDLSWKSSGGSKAIEYAVQLDCGNAVIDHASLYFHPSVRAKRKLLGPDDQGCGDAQIAQQAHQRGGTLQALHFLEIKRAGDIECAASVFERSGGPWRLNLAAFYAAIDSSEVPTGHISFKGKEQYIRAKQEECHAHTSFDWGDIRFIFRRS